MDYTAHTARILNRLGQAVSYTPVGGSVRAVMAVFSEPPAEFMNVEGMAPRVTCNIADVPAVDHDDEFLVGAINYRVVGINRNVAAGTVDLALEKQ